MKKLLFGLVLSLAVLTYFPAFGASCFPSEVLEKMLEDKYKEQLVVVGKTEEGHQFRLYASKDSRKWTVVVFGPNSRACVVASGTDLDTVMGKRPEISFSPEMIELSKKLLGIEV